VKSLALNNKKRFLNVLFNELYAFDQDSFESFTSLYVMCVAAGGVIKKRRHFTAAELILHIPLERG
jgi:hypothetical protein